MNNNRESRRHHNDDIDIAIRGSNRTVCTIGASNPINKGTEGLDTNVGGYPKGAIGHINNKQDAKQRKKAMQEFLKNKKWR